VETKVPFSALASQMGWDTATQSQVKRLLQAAQEIAPYRSFNEWFSARGDQKAYLAEYLRFKQMAADSQRLDGYVGNQRTQFLACELD
jgi:hypothetical protein